MHAEKRISNWQIVMLLIPLIIATETLPVTDLSAKFAHQRAWIAMIPSLVIGVWTIFVLTELQRRHPGKSIIEYSIDIFGNWIGRIIGFIILMQLWIYTSAVAAEALPFVSMFALPRTPKFVILLLFMTACGIAAWCGIEVIARVAEVFVPILILFFALVIIFLIPSMHPSFVRPILGPFWFQTVFQASIIPSGWYGEMLILGFLLPFTQKKTSVKDMRKIAYGVLFFIGGFMCVITLQSIMVSGPLSEKLAYSYYITARYVSLGDFFERIDPLIVSIWVYGLLIKDAILVFIFSLALVQLGGLGEHRIVVIPVTLLSMVGCLWFFPNMAETRSFLTYTFPFEGFCVQNLLPTFILFGSMLRSNVRRTKHA